MVWDVMSLPGIYNAVSLGDYGDDGQMRFVGEWIEVKWNDSLGEKQRYVLGMHENDRHIW